MTKPYDLIKKGNQIVRDLKYELQFTNDDEKQVERINSIIDILKAFDEMLVYKYYTDSLETLIYAVIYEQLMKNQAWKNDLPMYQILDKFKSDILFGKEYKKLEVISILKTHEMNNKIKSNNIDDLEETDFNKLITSFVNEIKAEIRWKKK